MIPSGQNGRAALRLATHFLHERLHGAPAFSALADGALDYAGYRDLLSRLASCYFTAAEFLPLEPERLQALRSDLLALHADKPEDLAWLAPAEPARALGWRYVVEGSIFGGRVIYRQLDYLFDNRCEGRSFFRGTANSAAHWRTLCTEIEHEACYPLGLDRMVEGATEAFSAFSHVLNVRKTAHA